jgi:hypothetical protein
LDYRGSIGDNTKVRLANTQRSAHGVAGGFVALLAGATRKCIPETVKKEGSMSGAKAHSINISLIGFI